MLRYGRAPGTRPGSSKQLWFTSMSIILELRNRQSHAGVPLVHPDSEHVVLANVFGMVRNLPPDSPGHKHQRNSREKAGLKAEGEIRPRKVLGTVGTAP
jgi:hypothetical protein